MASILVVGAGMAGLAASLFLARRGHEVDVLEQDESAPEGDADACFASWRRHGVAQARHAHVFVALSSKVLRGEAPDVLEALTAQAHLVDQPTGEAHLPLLAMRRLSFERLLRQAALAAPGVRFHPGRTAVSLIVEQSGGAPHVVGVTDSEGAGLRADFVADCSGRRSQAGAWLTAAGGRAPVEEKHPWPFIGFSRHYRLKPGRSYPGDGRFPIVAPLAFADAAGFYGDRRTFSLVFGASIHDPLRGVMARGDVFDRVFAAMKGLGDWIEAGEPLAGPFALAGIENGLRRLVDAEGPIATGLALVGDAAMYTDPVMGRGTSLAIAHAQGLAQRIDKAVDDPHGFANDFDAWTQANIMVWFSGSLMAAQTRDSQTASQFIGKAAEQAPPNFPNAIKALGTLDSDFARRAARVQNLLDPPQTLFSDPQEWARFQAQLELTRGEVALSRSDFEALVAA